MMMSDAYQLPSPPRKLAGSTGGINRGPARLTFVRLWCVGAVGGLFTEVIKVNVPQQDTRNRNTVVCHIPTVNGRLSCGRCGVQLPLLFFSVFSSSSAVDTGGNVADEIDMMSACAPPRQHRYSAVAHVPRVTFEA